MSRTVYVNGDYVAEEDAKISVFDRGFLFADGVYEVTSVLEGKLIDFAAHAARLRRSLNALDMKPAVSDAELLTIHRKLIDENGLVEGLIYLQVSRGVADRDFAYPAVETKPSIVLFTQAKDLVAMPLTQRGSKVVTVEDLRWGRRDIKTVQLLFPSMAKMEAKAQGADDAWLVHEGFVNEGTSNNAYIVTKDNVIVTRNLSNDILHGITRVAVLKCAAALQMRVEERPFSIEEALEAKEAFATAASIFVCPVVEINGTKIGSGEPGPVALSLRETYLVEARKSAI